MHVNQNPLFCTQIQISKMSIKVKTLYKFNQKGIYKYHKNQLIPIKKLKIVPCDTSVNRASSSSFSILIRAQIFIINFVLIIGSFGFFSFW